MATTTGTGRTVAGSAAHMERARRVIPRGVTSAMRALQRPTPLALRHSEGSRLVDVDGNEYVDYALAFGVAFLGHRPPFVLDAVRAQLEHGVTYGSQHAGEVEVAERLTRLVPCAELVCFSSTGSEAAHAALRIAKAATGRPLVVKFEGHYHGWVDPLYVNAPGVAPAQGPAPLPVVHAVPGLAPPSDVLVARFNDLDELEGLLEARGSEVAAVVMEAVPCNMGSFEPAPGYLEGVRALCDRHGCALVFDEVITGFRMAPGGAQERFGVTPDLAIFAKAVSSGFPLSVVAGRERFMRVAAGDGPVRHAGTYNGNAVGCAAAVASLDHYAERRDTLYPELERRSARLQEGLRAAAAEAGAPLVVNRVGGVCQLLWGVPTPTRSYADCVAGDASAVADLAFHLLDEGVHALERGLWFVSTVHTDEEIERTIAGAERALPRVLAAREGA